MEMAMKETVQQTLVETLDYLMTLVRDGIRPEEARSGLRLLQSRHGEVGMQLIWEEEAYDHSMHYDALLNLPGKGSVPGMHLGGISDYRAARECVSGPGRA